jgi:hypothetical protein
MVEFTFYLTDRRYTVPAVTFVAVRTTERARELAARLLAEDRNHVKVDVWEGDQRRFTLVAAPSEP